jgi:hypothetical protein
LGWTLLPGKKLSREFPSAGKRLGLDSYARYKALKRVSSAQRKARAGFICQVKALKRVRA